MGMGPNLYSFAPETGKLEAELRAQIIAAQNVAIKRHNIFRVAVSGGSLPKTLRKALLETKSEDPADKLDFSKWQIFYADERAVPFDHDDSNHKLVKEELLDNIPEELGKPKVFPIDTQYLDDTQELADQYQKTLAEEFARADSVKIPMFDLLLLGCGPDGHTCSLFPNSKLLREEDAWVLPIEDSPKPPSKRITLSLPVAYSGIKIFFVATGAGKKDIMKEIFDKEEGHQLPTGIINAKAQERVFWFTDKAATEDVQHQKRTPNL